MSEQPEESEDISALDDRIRREADAMRNVHDSLSGLPLDKRIRIIRAVAILMDIHLPELEGRTR